MQAHVPKEKKHESCYATHEGQSSALSFEQGDASENHGNKGH
jgi:hypothetical protein